MVSCPQRHPVIHPLWARLCCRNSYESHWSPQHGSEGTSPAYDLCKNKVYDTGQSSSACMHFCDQNPVADQPRSQSVPHWWKWVWASRLRKPHISELPFAPTSAAALRWVLPRSPKKEFLAILKSHLHYRHPRFTPQSFPFSQEEFPEAKAELHLPDPVRSPSQVAYHFPPLCWACSPAQQRSSWLSVPPGCITANAAAECVNSQHPGTLFPLWWLTKEGELLEARRGMMGISWLHPSVRIRCSESCAS